ncbi:MAG: hypothetical protein AB7F28_08155 [Candidatus Margulisiibacteriota bacterium]
MLYTDNNDLLPGVRSLLFDPQKRLGFANFKTALDEHQIRVTPQELGEFIQKTETQLYDQLFYFAHLMYRLMELSGDWGDAGEQHVKLSFCRCLLKLDPTERLTHTHTWQFALNLEQNYKQLGLNKWSEDELETQFEDYEFTLWNQPFTLHDCAELNKVLRYIGSAWFVQGGYYGHDKEMIIGLGRATQLGDYAIVHFEKEIMRTPNTVVAMAAVIGDKEIFVREESLITIFHEKWMPVLGYSQQEEALLPLSKARNISEGIKRRTIALYEAKTPEALAQKSAEFIADLGETVLYHELGHGIIQHTVLPADCGAFSEATKVMGENVFTAILEFLADFAPQNPPLRGPLYNMALVAQTDLERATRMFWMYFSDTWFFDTQEDYMYLYSDLMALSLLRYVRDDASIDFARIEHDLSWSTDPEPQDSLSLLDWTVGWIVSAATGLRALAESAHYDAEGGPVAFETFKVMADEEVKDDMAVTEDRSEYSYQTGLWANILDGLVMASDKKEQVDAFLRQEEQKVLSQFLHFSTTPDIAKTYGHPRDYVMDRLVALGITAVTQP